MPRQIIIKFWKLKYKLKILKIARKKEKSEWQQITPQKPWRPEGGGTMFFKCQKQRWKILICNSCCCMGSFLFTVEWCSTVWMYHHVVIHPPVEGYLGYFQFLVITNKATINIYIEAFVWTWIFITQVNSLGVIYLGLMISVCLTLIWPNTIC